MKKNTMIIIVVAILACAGMYFLGGLRGGGSKNNDSSSEKEQAQTQYSYVPGDYFVTNVKNSDKLFKVTVVLMLDTDKLNDQLDKSKYEIRDTILFTLRSLTEDDIRNLDIQDSLRKDLTDKLNTALGIHNIITVCFSDFVMS